MALNPQKLRLYAQDPMEFFAALILASGRGPLAFGKCIADFQRHRLTDLAPALVAVANHREPPIRRHWWEATKGASKDSDLAAVVLWLVAFSKRPLTIQVGAVDRDQADELHKAARGWLYLNAWLAKRVSLNNYRITCEATQSEAEIIPADVAGSHGARPDVLIINEVSHVQKQEFAENLLDNADKVPHGVVICAGNAGFRGSFAWRLRELARTSDRWAFHQFTEPAPWLNPADIDEARQRNSISRFARLWNGVWVSGGGDALDDDDIAAAIDQTLPPMLTRETGYGFVAGLDLGIKRDHSGFVIIGRRSSSQSFRVAQVSSWAPQLGGSVDLAVVEHDILEAHRRFRLYKVCYDPHQCEYLAQRLRKAGVPMTEVTFVGKNLDLMASTLLETFRSRLLTMFPSRLVSDLKKLCIVEKSFGYKLEAPHDDQGHADTAIALALALPAAKTMPSSCGESWGGVITVRPTGSWMRFN